MRPKSTEVLLRLLGERGEMSVQEFVGCVERVRGDYTDYYGAAGLLHSELIATDETTTTGDQKTRGKLGHDTHDTATTLFQIALPKGETFVVEGYPPRESWADFPVRIFITGEGQLKIEELDLRAEARHQKRMDYVFAIILAIFAATVGGFISKYINPPPSAPPIVSGSGK